MNRILLGILCSVLLFSACKKSETVNTPVVVAPQNMTTGIYAGKYIEAGTSTPMVIYQFRINVTQVNDSVYNITQIDAGNLPTFNMIASLRTISGTRTIIKFRIPHQDGGGGNDIVGDASSTGYDAYWDSLQKTFNFGIVFNSDPRAYIRLTAVKE